MNSYYKVPGRDVYCETLLMWAVSCFRCHVWLRVFPPNLPTSPK